MALLKAEIMASNKQNLSTFRQCMSNQKNISHQTWELNISIERIFFGYFLFHLFQQLVYSYSR